MHYDDTWRAAHYADLQQDCGPTWSDKHHEIVVDPKRIDRIAECVQHVFISDAVFSSAVEDKWDDVHVPR